MRKYLKYLIGIMFMFLFMGCTSQNNNATNESVDDLKIISLAPSNTEILVSLGLGENLILVDDYSKDISGVSEDIKVVNAFDVNIEEIISLEGDYLFLYGDKSLESKYSQIEEYGCEVIVIEPAASLEGIYDSINFIAETLKKESEGKKIVEELTKEIKEIEELSKDINKSVYFEISHDPTLFTFGTGTFLNEILEICGGENIFKEESGWIQVNEEAIIEKNPEIIFTNVSLEGSVSNIKNRVGFDNISAVKNNKVFYIDENNSSRPSGNIIKAVREISKILRDT